MKKLLIFGDGEFADIADEYFTHDSEYQVEAFVVEDLYHKEDTKNGKSVIKKSELISRYSSKEYDIFIAITFTNLNTVRERIYKEMKMMGYRLANYISSKSFVWKNVKIGDNVFIFENNTIQPFTEIENNVILWSGNHVGHRTLIKDNCFISSHVVISGYCTIGQNTFIGVNTTIGDNITIEKYNFIGAGCLISKNTEEFSIFKEEMTSQAKINTKRFFKLTNIEE